VNKTLDEELAELLTDGTRLQPSELNARLRNLWPLLHAPQRTHDTTALVAMFRRAGYVSDGLPVPIGEMTVYRGELVSSREAGIAWTADVEVVTQYARGYATTGNTRVWQAAAPPAAVLARFKQEAEVVVAPDLLGDFKNLGGFAHFKPSFLLGWTGF
jgi:hypothetical protein